MKTITIDDKTYEFLVNTGKEILTQDNRATRLPIFFTITERVDEARPEGCGEIKIIDECGKDVDDEAFCLCLLENLEEYPASAINFPDDPDLKYYDRDIRASLKYAAECRDVDTIRDIFAEDFEEYLSKNDMSEVYYEPTHDPTKQNGGVFFLTEKACKEHLRANKHNYREPHTFVGYAYCNPEIEQLCRFLTDLATAAQHQSETNDIATVRAFTSFLNPDELKDMQQIQETKDE